MHSGPERGPLVARHAAALGRARQLAAANSGDRAAEATRIVNQLAEALAWLGEPSAAALGSADALIAHAEARLHHLEDRAAVPGTRSAGCN